MARNSDTIIVRTYLDSHEYIAKAIETKPGFVFRESDDVSVFRRRRGANKKSRKGGKHGKD